LPPNPPRRHRLCHLDRDRCLGNGVVRHVFSGGIQRLDPIGFSFPAHFQPGRTANHIRNLNQPTVSKQEAVGFYKQLPLPEQRFNTIQFLVDLSHQRQVLVESPLRVLRHQARLGLFWSCPRRGNHSVHLVHSSHRSFGNNVCTQTESVPFSR